MSTALDAETAAAGEYIMCVWGYGAIEIDTDLGTTDQLTVVQAVQQALLQDTSFLPVGSPVALPGDSGAIYVGAKLHIPKQSDSQPYGSLLQPLQQISVGHLGSYATLAGADYCDASDNVYAVISPLAVQDPASVTNSASDFITQLGNESAQLLAALAAAAKKNADATLSPFLPWLIGGLVAVVGTIAIVGTSIGKARTSTHVEKAA